MPAYLVELPESGGRQLIGAADKMVVFAADEAGARAGAAGQFDGDGNALWNTLATVTEIVVGTTLADSSAGWEAFVRLSGAAALTEDLFVQARGVERLHIGAVALGDGGTATYVIDDILTAVGGTFTRAATFRVITVSTGVITAVELVDPGEYTVLPTLMTANPVSGGGGTLAELDLTVAVSGSYEAILGELVGLINVHPDIADAEVDLSEGAAGARLFTVSSISDDLGDGDLVFEFRHNGSAFAPLVSTLVDGGIAGAVITAAIPASPIAPPRVTPVKS